MFKVYTRIISDFFLTYLKTKRKRSMIEQLQGAEKRRTLRVNL